VSPFLLACDPIERVAVKFVKRMIGEKNIKAILQRLDRLTQDEARTTASETLKVIYGLVQNMTEVMNGEQIHIA
jgi:glucose-6-phosphate isomerase